MSTEVDLAYKTWVTCRLCGSNNLKELFTLGEQHVSNFVELYQVKRGPKAPLELVLCSDCSLVQLKHTAPQEILYKRMYWYRSSVTETMRRALRDVTESIEKRIVLQSGDVVLDIGANDGCLLRSYTAAGIIRSGVEPARNLFKELCNGVDYVVNDFWDYNLYSAKVGPYANRAKVITACGMLYDLDDPNRFIKDIARALVPDGLFVAQLMCLRNMIRSDDIGNIAHEHLEYYSLKSISRLFRNHGLVIVDLEENEVNGGSYRFYVKHEEAVTEQDQERMKLVRALMDQEELAGFDRVEFYQEWYKRLDENRRQCVDFIQQEVSRGKSVWVIGASTKGNVILQWYGLDHTLIGGASERSIEKVGLYTIGTGIKIYTEEMAREARPDYFLILPYAFTNEIIQREKHFLLSGGKLIVPLPHFRLVDKSCLR